MFGSINFGKFGSLKPKQPENAKPQNEQPVVAKSAFEPVQQLKSQPAEPRAFLLPNSISTPNVKNYPNNLVKNAPETEKTAPKSEQKLQQIVEQKPNIQTEQAKPAENKPESSQITLQIIQNPVPKPQTPTVDQLRKSILNSQKMNNSTPKRVSDAKIVQPSQVIYKKSPELARSELQLKEMTESERTVQPSLQRQLELQIQQIQKLQQSLEQTQKQAQAKEKTIVDLNSQLTKCRGDNALLVKQNNNPLSGSKGPSNQLQKSNYTLQVENEDLKEQILQRGVQIEILKNQNNNLLNELEKCEKMIKNYSTLQLQNEILSARVLELEREISLQKPTNNEKSQRISEKMTSERDESEDIKYKEDEELIKKIDEIQRKQEYLKRKVMQECRELEVQ